MLSFILLFPGNSLPTVSHRASSVQYMDTFVVVGGYSDGTGNLDTILKYNTNNDTWSELPEKLKKARSDHTAIMVDRSIFPECP